MNKSLVMAAIVAAIALAACGKKEEVVAPAPAVVVVPAPAEAPSAEAAAAAATVAVDLLRSTQRHRQHRPAAGAGR